MSFNVSVNSFKELYAVFLYVRNEWPSDLPNLHLITAMLQSFLSLSQRFFKKLHTLELAVLTLRKFIISSVFFHVTLSIKYIVIYRYIDRNRIINYVKEM
jgi:hypothetical protein